MACFENRVINSHVLWGLVQGQSTRKHAMLWAQPASERPPHVPQPPPSLLCLRFSCCPQLIFHYFLFLFLSASLSFWIALNTSSPPPSCPPRPCSPPLHRSASTRQRVIHLHWADACAVLTVRALTSERKESSDPVTAKTHYRRENTSDHQLPKPIRLHQQLEY